MRLGSGLFAVDLPASLLAAVPFGAALLLASVVTAQTVKVDAGHIAIWQDLTNTSGEADRIPQYYRYPVCRVVPRDKLLVALSEFGPSACPTPLEEPSIRGSAHLILQDLPTGELENGGRLTVQFVVERADGTEQQLVELIGEAGYASGRMAWAPMNLEQGDLIVVRLRVRGAARSLKQERAILLVTLGS